MGTRRIAEECLRVDVRSLRESGEIEDGDVAVTIPNGREVQTVGVEWTPLHLRRGGAPVAALPGLRSPDGGPLRRRGRVLLPTLRESPRTGRRTRPPAAGLCLGRRSYTFALGHGQSA